MIQKKILLLGANGMLGKALQNSFLKNTNKYVIHTHSQSTNADFMGNLSSIQHIEDLLLKNNFDFCINTVALTDVNRAEEDFVLARKLNVLPVQNLVSVILKNNLDTKLIQISTDHVYDKNNSREDEIKILNQYALTKYIADEIASLVPSVVLRTNFFGNSLVSKKSFSDWVIFNLSKKNQISGFDDVYFNPLHVSTLCDQIFHVMENFKCGIYNLGSSEGMTKYEFICYLADLKNLDKKLVTPLHYNLSKEKIKRPNQMIMNIDKFQKSFDVKLPRLSEEISKC